MFFLGQIAQSVEQRTENPRVGGSIPSLTTSKPFDFVEGLFVYRLNQIESNKIKYQILWIHFVWIHFFSKLTHYDTFIIYYYCFIWLFSYDTTLW